MKKAWKFIKRAFLAIFGLIAAYLAVALVLSAIPANRTAPSCKNEKTFYLSTNGVHLDIIFSVGDIHTVLSEDITTHKTDGFLAFGWGDRDFYLNTPEWGDLSFSTAVNALFLRSETLMHVTPYAKARSDWIAISVCENEFRKLESYVANTFRDDGGKVLISGRSYGHQDSFFRAMGSYSCLYTCNTWVNSGLKSIGLKTAVWTPFDFGVMWHFE